MTDEQAYEEFWDKLINGQLPPKIAISVILSMATDRKGDWDKAE